MEDVPLLTTAPGGPDKRTVAYYYDSESPLPLLPLSSSSSTSSTAAHRDRPLLQTMWERTPSTSVSSSLSPSLATGPNAP